MITTTYANSEASLTPESMIDYEESNGDISEISVLWDNDNDNALVSDTVRTEITESFNTLNFRGRLKGKRDGHNLNEESLDIREL